MENRASEQRISLDAGRGKAPETDNATSTDAGCSVTHRSASTEALYELSLINAPPGFASQYPATNNGFDHQVDLDSHQRSSSNFTFSQPVNAAAVKKRLGKARRNFFYDEDGNDSQQLDRLAMQDPDDLLSRTEREERDYRLTGSTIPFEEQVNPGYEQKDHGDNFKDPAENTPLSVKPDFPHIPHAILYDDKSFLDHFKSGKATLSYQGDNGYTRSLQGLDLDRIEQRCPLLAFSFEDTRGGGSQFFAEILTEATCVPFVRFIYLGSYAWNNVYDDVPTSLLLHCKMYRIGDIYDLPELKSQAYVNVVRQCQFGCSTPEKPIDLCDAIDMVYLHLRDHQGLLDEILHYCVSCFIGHQLGEDKLFKQLAYQTRAFHQDLCKTAKARNFEDESATAIIQMPFEHWTPTEYLSREDVPPSRQCDPGSFRVADQHIRRRERYKEAMDDAQKQADASWLGLEVDGVTLSDPPRSDGNTSKSRPTTGLEFSGHYRYGLANRSRGNLEKRETAFLLNEEGEATLPAGTHDLATKQVISTQEEGDAAWLVGEDYLAVQQMETLSIQERTQMRMQEREAEATAEAKSRLERDFFATDLARAFRERSASPKSDLEASFLTAPMRSGSDSDQATDDDANTVTFAKRNPSLALGHGTAALSAALASDSDSDYENIALPKANTPSASQSPDVLTDSEDDLLVNVQPLGQRLDTSEVANDKAKDDSDSGSGSDDWSLV